jgi:hypothetical protein
MSRSKRSANSSVNEGIQANNVNAKALAVGKGAQAIVNETRGPDLSDELKKLFENLAQKTSELPESPEKGIAQSAISALENEAKLGNEAKEANVTKWLNFLAQAAPDIWDVAIATFANPVAGLGVVFKKVAERAKEEKGLRK